MTKTFEVSNLKCGGCANTITKALNEKFSNVSVDVEGKNVTVDLENEADEAALKTTLRSLGYPLVTDKLGFIEDNALKAKSFVSCAIGKFDTNKGE